MRSEHVEFLCGACGLAIEADESPDGAEEDESFLRVFWCGGEKRSMVLDAEAPAFRGHCPECRGPLALLRFPLAACPKCLVPAKARRAFTGPL